MLEKLKDDILDYCRSENKSSVRLANIVSVAESLSIEEKIGMANALVLIDETSDILAEAYKSVNMDDAVLEQHFNMISGIKKGMEELNYDNEDHYQKVVEMYSQLNNVSQIRNTDEYMYQRTVDVFEKVLESMDRRIVLEGADIEWNEDIALETAMARTQAEFDLAFTHFAMGPDNLDFLVENANNMIRLSNRYDRLLLDKYDVTLEADGHHIEVKKSGKVVSTSGGGGGKPNTNTSGAKKAAIKADQASRKASSKLRKGASDAKSVGVIAAKAGGRFTGLLSNTLGKLDDLNKQERMEAVLAGGMRRKISTLMRNAVLVGSATAINPLLGLITLLTTSALRKKSDKRLLQEIKADYEGELKLVKEKIRDAESAGDRKKKYELMRIETHIEQNIERLENPEIRRNRPKLRKG